MLLAAGAEAAEAVSKQTHAKEDKHADQLTMQMSYLDAKQDKHVDQLTIQSGPVTAMNKKTGPVTTQQEWRAFVCVDSRRTKDAGQSISLYLKSRT